MSKKVYFSKIKTYSINERNHKESSINFPDPSNPIEILENENLKGLAKKVKQAKEKNKEVTFMLGGNVIKTGMSPYIIDLMEKEYITHLSMNGSTSIHDFEIAYFGETSEDVLQGLKDGSFGMIEETGREMNRAINKAAFKGWGYGYAIGKLIEDLNCKNKEHSLLYHAFKKNILATVHVAIGNDTIHQHPTCKGENIGKTSHIDFKKLVQTLSQSKEGVILNIGSAVILPETFLKALTIAKNLRPNLENITTANLDMIDHYRPRLNVVERPTKALGGKGFNIIGNHKQTIPSLYKLITQ